MPIEIMAKRGPQTLTFGPMKPVGLMKPDGTKPYAVVQLRQDDAAKEMYNLVGFQTHLKFGEQKRVFQMIPGLENAVFVKYGRMHKNTYINAPKILKPSFQTKKYPNLFFAGQISGVEGYVESAASGIYAAINMDRYLTGREQIIFPASTVIGSMSHYICNANPEGFQPMNANFGILPELDVKIKDKSLKKKAYTERAIESIKNIRRQTMEFRGTTIIGVKKDGKIVLAGDGQVTAGEHTIFKGNARKVRRIFNDKVVIGFAGSTADAFNLSEHFEKMLEKIFRQLREGSSRACTIMAKRQRHSSVRCNDDCCRQKTTFNNFR